MSDTRDLSHGGITRVVGRTTHCVLGEWIFGEHHGERGKAHLSRARVGAIAVGEARALPVHHEVEGVVVDYLLKLLVSDIADYDRVYKRIIAGTPLADVSSSFAMERIKYTTEVPLAD